MVKHLKKVLTSILTMLLIFTSINIDVFAGEIDVANMKPGEVTQKKSATWSDYENGIAEITFDVVGKNAEEPIDVVLVYDNSGSMQNSNPVDEGYLTSRWNYASIAAKTFTKELLKNKDNNIAFVPFSDKLIDGNSKHSNPSEFFESHEYIYDENGNPDIETMKWIVNYYQDFEQRFLSQEEFVAICEEYFQINPLQLEKKENAENAVVPFTKDEAKINDAIDGLYPAHLGTTNYEVALKGAKEALAKSDSERKIVVMISDGKPDEDLDGIQVANEIKASGATIYTCGTGLKSGEEETLKQIASKENNVPLYFSSNPEDLTSTLEKMRKQFEVAAHDGVITDEINTEFFEYYSDETHYPTVNDIRVNNEELVVSENNGLVTWNIGNIREESKTLKFYVKVIDSKLNDDLFDKDESLLNDKGDYATNGKANLVYTEVNSKNLIETGHEMESPTLSVHTATLKQTYYLSDANGNIVEKDGQKVVLWEEESSKKAFNVDYIIAPKASIEVDGETYFILKEDNKETVKRFTHNDEYAKFSFRYVKQLNVTFDTNNTGLFDDNNDTMKMLVDHTSMTIPELPTIKEIPSNMRFIGWNTKADGMGEVFTNTTDIKNDMTVYAQWAKIGEYVVTFKNSDGTTMKVESVLEGGDATAPTNSNRTGYTFIGWDKEFTNVTSDLTVNAKHEANKYYVNFDKNGATSGNMNQQEFTYDVAQNLSKNTLTRENYTFAGWLYNGKVYTDEEEVINLTANANEQITLVAQWTKQKAVSHEINIDDRFTNAVVRLDDLTKVLYETNDLAYTSAMLEEIGKTYIADLNYTNVEYKGYVVQVKMSNSDEWTTYTEGMELSDEAVVRYMLNIAEVNIDTVPPVGPEVPNVPTPPVTPETPATPETPVTPATPEVPVEPATPTIPDANPTTPVTLLNNPVAVAQTQPDAVPVAEEIITENETPLANNPTEQIQENETPLANNVGASWALVNLICSILTILSAIILFFSKRKREEEDDEEDMKEQQSTNNEEQEELQKRRLWVRIVSIAIALISIIVFILTENVFNPMILVDSWTLTMVIILVVQIITFIIGRKWKDVEQEEEEPETV